MGNEVIELKVERIHKLNGDSPLKGFADISIAGTFLVKGLKIVSGKEGLFVSMPSEQGKDGNWYNTVYPLSKGIKEKLNNIILSAYKE